MTNSGRPLRCFCGAVINGDVEGHRADGERRWVAEGHNAEERCTCLPCAQHSEDEHAARELKAFEQAEEEERQFRRIREAMRAEIARVAEPPALVNADEAARLLGITPAALRQRVQHGQVPGVVRTGRRVQFARAVLVGRIERRAER